MKLWRLVWAGLILVMMGCATSPLRQAQSFQAKGEYRKALDAYLKVMNVRSKDGKKFINYDPEAVNGVGGVLLSLKQTQKAAKVFNYVLKRTPNDGKALFYLGSCYEALSRPDMALKTYAKYPEVDPGNAFRETMRWRLDWLVRQQIAREIKASMESEQRLSVESLPSNTVAVLYFYNLSDNPRWNPLQKGLADMMITDLSQLDQIKTVERLRIQKLFEEMNLSMTGMMDEKQTARFGKLIGARTLVKGSYMIMPDMNIEVGSSVVDVVAGKMPELVKMDGTLSQLFMLEKKIILQCVTDLRITLTPDQREQIMKLPTSNFKAFLNYCYGLDALDMGNFEASQHYFNQAAALDPSFMAARDYLVPVDIFNATQLDVTAMQDRLMNRGSSAGPGGTEPVDATLFAADALSRLQTMGIQMDAGFIPGADSRDPMEASGGGDLPIGELPGPPSPPNPQPGITDRWYLPVPPNPPTR
jgi:tetratricopeptide (TPR) repeat protein